MANVDVLMIAHRRAHYLARSLPRLLDSLPPGARAWVWQNDTFPATTQVIEEYRSHPRFHRFHHSPENQGLTPATNWLWQNADGDLFGKVDDDCLIPQGWVEEFVAAHDRPRLGVIAAWHFPAEDLLPETLETRTTPIDERRSLIRNCWVGGSGYLMKRACVDEQGYVSDNRGFTKYCLDLAASGWEIGWHYPLVIQDHMDDPRSPNSAIRTDHDLQELAPLSSHRLTEPTVEAWIAQLRASALTVQTASLRPQDHRGWRRRLKRLLRRGQRVR